MFFEVVVVMYKKVDHVLQKVKGSSIPFGENVLLRVHSMLFYPGHMITVSVCREYEFKNCLALRPGLDGQDVWAILLEGACFAHLDGRRWLAGLAGREKLLLLVAADDSWLTWRGNIFYVNIFVHKWSILGWIFLHFMYQYVSLIGRLEETEKKVV